VVVDSRASLSSASQLVRTAREVPVLVAAGPQATEADRRRLEQSGCEVFVGRSESQAERLEELLDELGRRRMTNVLVEGGGFLLGAFFDAGQIDEVHVFIAPKLVGGESARSTIEGEVIDQIPAAPELEEPVWNQVGRDMYLSGRVAR
jgi:diaminohydroxyphosphoribosylaminopyrimidine deaminase/5-amino-6-(5-phosphoribosylamino)uracil reductase